MNVSIKGLRSLVVEVVKASASYMRKENVREKLQQLIVASVSSGEIKSQKELDEFFATLTMSANALKMVPFDVFANLSNAPAPTKRSKK